MRAGVLCVTSVRTAPRLRQVAGPTFAGWMTRHGKWGIGADYTRAAGTPGPSWPSPCGSWPPPAHDHALIWQVKQQCSAARDHAPPAPLSFLASVHQKLCLWKTNRALCQKFCPAFLLFQLFSRPSSRLLGRGEVLGEPGQVMDSQAWDSDTARRSLQVDSCHSILSLSGRPLPAGHSTTHEHLSPEAGPEPKKRPRCSRSRSLALQWGL